MRTTIVSLLLCFFGGQINADCAIYTTVDVGLVGYTLRLLGTVKVEGFVLFARSPEISSQTSDYIEDFLRASLNAVHTT